MAEFFVQVSDDLTDDAGAASFQSYHYRTMQLDACRMAHYRRDIARLAPGARVLEVGSRLQVGVPRMVRALGVVGR